MAKLLSEIEFVAVMPMFECMTVHFIVSDSPYKSFELRDLLEPGETQEDADHARANTHASGDKVYIVINKSMGLNFRSIAHECVHAAGQVMQFTGVHPSFENDEPFAYAVDWMIGWITECLQAEGIELAPYVERPKPTYSKKITNFS